MTTHERVKDLLARIARQFHKHNWDGRDLDLPIPVWPFKAPYLELCDCGATRMRENR